MTVIARPSSADRWRGSTVRNGSAGEVATNSTASASRAFRTTLVVLATIVAAIVLWKLKVLIALLLAAVSISAAMRPGVEWLARRRIPRIVGVLLHYLVFLALVALFLSFVVPRLLTEVSGALQVKPHAHPAGGIKAKLLDDLERHLHHLPAAGKLIHPALSIGETALEVLVAILFTFVAAAYWLFERERAVDLVASLVARPKRKKLRDTWELIDQKLGAFIRGQLIMLTIVCTLASTLFAAVGEPYWLLLGIAAGLLEIVPAVGPAVAILMAVGAGLTVSWEVAAMSAGGLLALRLVQD